MSIHVSALTSVFLAALLLLTSCNYSVEKQAGSPNRPSKPAPPVNAPEDGGSQPPEDGSAATYSQIAPILKAKCVMCHNERQAAMNFRADNYDSLVNNPRSVIPGDAENSGAYASVVDNYMPLKSAVQRGEVEPLTPEEKEMLKSWIDAGALNN